MARFNRGIAGERAAVREAQREAAQRLGEEASRLKPSLGKSTTNTTGTKWSPNGFTVSPPQRVPSTKFDVAKADAVQLNIEKCLDMVPIKKGSFFYMSVNYVEEVQDWCTFHEDQRGSTF
ncbi:hypothetical protein F4804DRAFT_92035 [Jackrogersella minutella]|nr:hypothetical protein F4804DRAFT_92035 [Jackrogersella minutella]